MSNIGPEDFDEQDERADLDEVYRAEDQQDDFDELEDGQRCESCGMNLELYPCTCGPAGPRLGGVWTGGNARYNEVAAADMGVDPINPDFTPREPTLTVEFFEDFDKKKKHRP